ncbi:cytochrome P450 [Aspergillus unguis]
MEFFQTWQIWPVLGAILFLTIRLFKTDIPKLKHVPELPNALPLYGHLKHLGNDHASAFESFYKENTQTNAVVQARLGNRRVLVLNSFAAAQEFIVKNASATIDRPLFYTFHGIVSKTQGGTIGTAPWSESTKRMRTVAGALMSRPAVQRSAPMIDVETAALVGDLSKAANGREVDPRIFFQRLALNLTLVWCYGTRIEGVEDPLLHEILRVAHSVSSFRSTNNNIQDYVPLYRYLPTSSRTKKALEDRTIRDRWLNELYQKVVDAVAAGKETSCISAGLLNDRKDDDTSKIKLTESEIKSINVSFVSGGFETLATSGLACLAYLSTAEGQDIQEKAFADIIASHGSVQNAWNECLLAEKSAYVVALVREGLRFYAPLPLLNPRQTAKEFTWRGGIIPKGLSIHMNTQSINHDPAAYGPDADIFRPERWLDEEAVKPPYQYSFGAGSRMCPAVGISNRVLYATYVRLLVKFRVVASGEMPPDVDYVGFNEDTSGQSAIPKRYKVRLEMRDIK